MFLAVNDFSFFSSYIHVSDVVSLFSRVLTPCHWFVLKFSSSSKTTNNLQNNILLNWLIKGWDPDWIHNLGPITCFRKKSVNVDLPIPCSHFRYNTDWFFWPLAIFDNHLIINWYCASLNSPTDWSHACMNFSWSRNGLDTCLLLGLKGSLVSITLQGNKFRVLYHLPLAMLLDSIPTSGKPTLAFDFPGE